MFTAVYEKNTSQSKKLNMRYHISELKYVLLLPHPLWWLHIVVQEGRGGCMLGKQGHSTIYLTMKTWLKTRPLYLAGKT